MTPVQRWKEAHPAIAIGDDSLAVMAPFPSLYANDFVVLMQSRGDDPKIAEFVRDIHREMVWAYDNWAKAQHDGDQLKLLLDMLNNATGSGYDFVRKFLLDYAKANNINLSVDDNYRPDWFSDVQEVAE